MRATKLTLALVVLVGLTVGGLGVAAAGGDSYDKHDDWKDEEKKTVKSTDAPAKEKTTATPTATETPKPTKTATPKPTATPTKTATPAEEKKQKAVQICHVDWTGAETRNVSKTSAKNHLKYHKYDHLGPCMKKSDRKKATPEMKEEARTPKPTETATATATPEKKTKTATATATPEKKTKTATPTATPEKKKQADHRKKDGHHDGHWKKDGHHEKGHHGYDHHH